MPRYAPHTLPAPATRPQQEKEATPNKATMHPAIQLGQHIRRERGMHGVRGYAASMRDYLNEQEYKELCSSMGVPTDLPSPNANQQTRQSPPPNTGNQLQALQAFAQLMSAQNNTHSGAGMPGMAGMLGQLMGAGQQSGGGLNPGMLAQLLGGQSAVGGGGSGIDPMMLAQLIGGLQK